MKKITLSVLLINTISFAAAHVGEDDSTHHSMMDWMYGGTGYFGWIIPLLVVTALVLFIVWLLKEIQKK